MPKPGIPLITPTHAPKGHDAEKKTNQQTRSWVNEGMVTPVPQTTMKVGVLSFNAADLPSLKTKEVSLDGL